MKFMLKTKVTDSKMEDGKVKLVVEPSQGGDAKELEADVVLVSAGEKHSAQRLVFFC